MHANIHANEAVPSDIKFTSAATNDSFMLKPANYTSGDILAFDRAYIDYAKLEELTRNGVIYVTKIKKNLVYAIGDDTMYMRPDEKMSYRIQHVTFTKYVKDGEDIVHKARIITYVGIKKTRAKLISLLTNDMEMPMEEIVEIYRKRREIELLFKQLKQNFPLRNFYGESSNAIKIQIWVTLIANLLIMVLQKRIKRPLSFRDWLRWSESCSCITSTVIHSLRNQKRIGWPSLKVMNCHQLNRCFLIKGLTFENMSTNVYMITLWTHSYVTSSF